MKPNTNVSSVLITMHKEPKGYGQLLPETVSPRQESNSYLDEFRVYGGVSDLHTLNLGRIYLDLQWACHLSTAALAVKTHIRLIVTEFVPGSGDHRGANG